MASVKNFIALLIFSIVCGSSANAATFTEIDFSDWDASILSTPGGSQVFTDICGDLDVTVTANGEFDATTYYVSTQAGGTNAVSSQHDPGAGSSNSHGFTFSFSDAVDVIIQTMSLDGQEQYVISGTNTPSYTNLSGAMPIVTSNAGSVTLDGVGFGFDPVTGSSFGETLINSANSVTVAYNATPANFTKYGSFRVFKAVPVPEPNSAGLLAIGGLALLGGRRRRR